ncbi:MAG: SycD/LcrH family type III secretion system chaperone [Parachlamydiaceae bacterium]|nr:SycD/LcrH family type III secretion system chaperone [Parachlamydiaceae bacterium]
MKGGREDIKKVVEQMGEGLEPDQAKKLEALGSKIAGGGVSPRDAMGLDDKMIEGIYAQAYRLYNTGKYKEASQLFRLLIMLNGAEPKYSLGFAACFHMSKEYATAAEVYTTCGMIDPNNPIPHYHASDCYVQLGDKISALIALEMAVKRSGTKPEYSQLKDRALMTIESLKADIAKPDTP